nr:polyprotein [Cassava Torrado-like virus]
MVSFSKLVSLPARISDTLDVFNATMSKFTKGVETVESDVLPSLEGAASSFTDTCSRVSTLLDKVTSFFEPVFRAAGVVRALWNALKGSFLSIFSSAVENVHYLFTKLIVTTDVDWSLVFPLMLVCVILVSFVWSIPQSILHSVVATFSVCFQLTLSFLETILPQSWVPKWLKSFFSATECIAQFTPTPPVEGVDTSFTSASISTILLFGLTTFAYTFANVSSSIKKQKTGNFIADCLWSSGDYSAKCNQLFTLFRNMQNHMGSLIGRVMDFLFDLVGCQNPTLSAIDKLVKTDLFDWMKRVDKICDPKDRLSRYAGAEYGEEMLFLRQQADDIKRACTLRPPVAFLASRLNKNLETLDKVWADYCAHRGVGQSRQEPFMMQWYGKPGVGKTLILNYFISDLFRLMGEPKANQIYAVPIGDKYWSGYAHQTGVLFDDLGALQDGSGQCEDVKSIISLKSSQPVGLSMAAIEEKGTHFDSKYIFCTSNEMNPPSGCGLVTVEAFHRRRDILVEVCREGKLGFENPAEGATFTLRHSLAPNNVVEGMEKLSYTELLGYVHNQAEIFFARGKNLVKIESLALLQDTVKENIAPMAMATPLTADDIPIESCKRMYMGSLGKNIFLNQTYMESQFAVLSEEQQEKVFRWCRAQIDKPLNAEQMVALMTYVPESHIEAFKVYASGASFSEKKFLEKIGTDAFLHDCLTYEADEDLEELVGTWPLQVKYQFAQLVRFRHTCKIFLSNEPPAEPFSPWYIRFAQKFLEGFGKLPLWLQLAIRFLAVYWMVQTVSASLGAVFKLPNMLCSSIAGALTASVEPQQPVAMVANQSGDYKTARPKRTAHRFLTAQAAFEARTWCQTVEHDPFLQHAYPENVVCIRLPGGGFFRGLLVDTDWMMTVNHAFYGLKSGTKLDLIFRRSATQFLLDRRPTHFHELPGKDVCFIKVSGIDGAKKSLRKHFAKKGRFSAFPGSEALFSVPMLDLEQNDGLLMVKNNAVTCENGNVGPIKYEGADGFIFSSTHSLRIRHTGTNGECGSVLFAPNLENKQPVIVGIQCAGFKPDYVEKGVVGSYVTLVTQEDLSILSESLMCNAMMRPDILDKRKQKANKCFDDMQVYYLGTVPREMAAEVPHKTTLIPSPIHATLEEMIGPHQSEPSILSAKDARLVEEKLFDPYLMGIEKYNETAQCFNMPIAERVFKEMSEKLLYELRKVPVPGGKPTVRDVFESLNGIPAQEYYDSMDFNTSCGYPLNSMGFGKSKINFVKGEAGEKVFDEEKPAFAMYEELIESVEQGLVLPIVTTECAKDERLPLKKIYDTPKTRLFTILPFHYNVAVRRYFLDFSATMMRAKSTICSKVGIDAHGVDWTELALQFLEVNTEGFSADYSSFDGRAPVFIFQWFCDLVDEFYGDRQGSPESLARHALLMMASDRYTLCGSELFRVLGGMPSGFSLTVIFNSLLNEFYMRYAFAVMLTWPSLRSFTVDCTSSDFERLFVAVYGDDNLVATPYDLKWYTLPRIAEVLLGVNVVIKNGCDKNADVNLVTTQPLSQLVFLSRGFSKTRDSFYKAPLKWISVTERLYWIRQSALVSPLQALEENVNSALLEAHHHGEAVFRGLYQSILQVYQKHKLPFPALPSYQSFEATWLSKVTGSQVYTPGLKLQDTEKLPERTLLSGTTWDREINECFPSVYCISGRTYKKEIISNTMICVNCTAQPKAGCIQGPHNADCLAARVWAFTLQAIFDEQSTRIARGQVCTGICFVSASGSGIALICSGLFALAQAKYASEDILHTVKSLSGAENLMKYAAGAGAYLVRATCGDNVAQYHSSSLHLKGTNMLDRMFSIDVFDIVIGVSWNTQCFNFSTYWASMTHGSGDVRTCLEFAEKDSDSAMLMRLKTAARKSGRRVILLFNSFSREHATWLYRALDDASVSSLACADLFNVVTAIVTCPVLDIVPYGMTLCKEGTNTVVTHGAARTLAPVDEIVGLSKPASWWRQQLFKMPNCQMTTQKAYSLCMLACCNYPIQANVGNRVRLTVDEIYGSEVDFTNSLATLSILIKLDEASTLTFKQTGKKENFSKVLDLLGICIVSSDGFLSRKHDQADMSLFDALQHFGGRKFCVHNDSNILTTLFLTYALNHNYFSGTILESIQTLLFDRQDVRFVEMRSALAKYVHSQEVSASKQSIQKFLITTTNEGKRQEYIAQNQDKNLEFSKIETIEIQGSVQEIAVDKFRKVVKQVSDVRMIVSEDVSLEIDQCRLGPYVKFFSVSDFSGFVGRKAILTLVQCVGSTTSSTFFMQTKIIEGKISDPRGENGFGFDKVFEVKGRTLAEMTNDEKYSFGLRKITAHELGCTVSY